MIILNDESDNGINVYIIENGLEDYIGKANEATLHQRHWSTKEIPIEVDLDFFWYVKQNKPDYSKAELEPNLQSYRHHKRHVFFDSILNDTQKEQLIPDSIKRLMGSRVSYSLMLKDIDSETPVIKVTDVFCLNYEAKFNHMSSNLLEFNIKIGGVGLNTKVTFRSKDYIDVDSKDKTENYLPVKW